METQPSAQSPFQKLNFGSSSQKTRKGRYQTLFVLSSFTGFLYSVPNTLPRIVGPGFKISHIIHVYHIFISVYLTNCQKYCINDNYGINNQRRIQTATASKMDLFVIIVNGFQPLTIITKCSILDIAAVLDPPLIIVAMRHREIFSMFLIVYGG